MVKTGLSVAIACTACCCALFASATVFAHIISTTQSATASTFAGHSRGRLSYENTKQAPSGLLQDPHGVYHTSRSRLGRGAGEASGAVTIIKSPNEGYDAIADKGAAMVEDALLRHFMNSYLGGCFVGLGSLLALSLSSTLQGHLQLWAYAFLFPMNLFVIQLTGATLFTSTTAVTVAALLEGKLSKKGRAGIFLCLRTIAIAWAGNCIGTLAFGAFATLAGLNVGPTAALAIQLAHKKTHLDFFTALFRGIGCNWMVCLAVYMTAMAQDFGGKYLAIFLPLSTFIACGFEHAPANMFTLPFGIMAGADISMWTVLIKNWIPVSLGSWFAGSGIVAVGYSLIYGRLGSALVDRIDKATARAELRRQERRGLAL